VIGQWQRVYRPFLGGFCFSPARRAASSNQNPRAKRPCGELRFSSSRGMPECRTVPQPCGADLKLTLFTRFCNEERPHSSLGYLPPAVYAHDLKNVTL
jgi:hypothetical protein